MPLAFCSPRHGWGKVFKSDDLRLETCWTTTEKDVLAILAYTKKCNFSGHHVKALDSNHDNCITGAHPVDPLTHGRDQVFSSYNVDFVQRCTSAKLEEGINEHEIYLQKKKTERIKISKILTYIFL